MLIHHCDTSAYNDKVRKSRLFVQCPEIESSMEMLSDAGLFSLPLREGDYAGSLFDFAYSVGFTLESLTIMNDLDWPRTASPFIVGMFGALKKLGFQSFPRGLRRVEESLVDQGLPTLDEIRIKVPLENQIFAHMAFALINEEWNNQQQGA